MLFTQEVHIKFSTPLTIRELIGRTQRYYEETRKHEEQLCKVAQAYLEAARDVCLFDSSMNSAPVDELLQRLQKIKGNLLEWHYPVFAVSHPDLDPYDVGQRKALAVPVARLMQTPLERLDEMLVYNCEPDFVLYFGWNLGVLITGADQLDEGEKFIRSLNQLVEVLSSNWQMLLNYYDVLTEELQQAQSQKAEGVEKGMEEQLHRLQGLKVEIENYYGEFDVSYFCQEYYQG